MNQIVIAIKKVNIWPTSHYLTTDPNPLLPLAKRSTKRSHGEPVMAPKLHTSQIFKGRAYELNYRAYGFCLNKQQANLLQYLGVIFSKPEKIITDLKFARVQRSLHSECIKTTTVEFFFGRSLISLRCRDAILGDPGAVSRVERKGATKVFKHESFQARA